MVDFVSADKRSRIMRGAKSKNTKPELRVRALLRELGVGYRLHRKDLPGKPDISFIGRKKAIFVHGCFWHQHGKSDCPIVRKPESNSSFWNDKFKQNKLRDARNLSALQDAGWSTLEIWECELEDDDLKKTLANFLGIS